MVTSTHTNIVRNEIHEYQNRLHGELANLHPDATCVYPSGTQDTEWWKNKSLYDPDDLRNCPYEIPHRVFLSDRVVAFVLLHPERWTVSKRHEYWPGDFASNGMPVSGRVLTGRPAITTTGALVEIRGYGILCGETKIARAKVVRTAYIWKPSEIKKGKKVQPDLIPDVFCGLRSRDVAPAVLEVLFRSLIRYHDEQELTKDGITEPPALEVEIASLKRGLATLQRREARREDALKFLWTLDVNQGTDVRAKEILSEDLDYAAEGSEKETGRLRNKIKNMRLERTRGNRALAFVLQNGGLVEKDMRKLRRILHG